MNELLLVKTEALPIKQFTPRPGAGSLRHLSYLFENSQFPGRKAQLLSPSTAPETIPERDQSSLGV